MHLQEYKKKLLEIEQETELICQSLNIEFSVKRLLHFSTMKLSSINMQSFSLRIYANENYEDINNLKIVNDAKGIREVAQKKSAKHQIYLLGHRKIFTMTQDEAIVDVTNAIKLLGLYELYNSLKEQLLAEHSLKFPEHISCLSLSMLDSSYNSISAALANYNEFLEWNNFISDLDNEKRKVLNERNEELSIPK